MSRRGRGMRHNVAQAMGLTYNPERTAESVRCTCGTAMQFGTNGIGQIVECCANCGWSQRHLGPRMLTRADKVEEQGLTKSGKWDDNYRRYGRRKPKAED